MNDPRFAPAPPSPAQLSRRVIPEQVHAAAFLAYALALTLFSLGMAGAAQPPSEVPAWVTTGAIGFALAAGGLGLGVHFGRRACRPWLAVVGGLAALGSLDLLAVSGAAAKMGALVLAVTWLVMARLPYGPDGERYFNGQTQTHAEALAHPLLPRSANAPAWIWLAVVYFAVAAVGCLLGTIAALAQASQVVIGPVVGAGLMVALISGLVRGRLWARAYGVLVSALGAAGCLVVLTGLWDAATLDDQGPFAPKPPDVSGPVTLAVALLVVNVTVLYGLAWSRQCSEFFAHGR